MVQPIYQVAHKTEQKLIAYSLGNFISSQRKPNTDGGIILKVRLEKNFQSNDTFLMGHEYIPVWRHIEQKKDGKKVYRVLPIQDFQQNDHPNLTLSATDLSKMNSFAQKLTKHLDERR